MFDGTAAILSSGFLAFGSGVVIDAFDHGNAQEDLVKSLQMN